MIELIRKVLKHIPPRDEILPVFGTIVFFVFGWSFIVFFWKLPSWLDFLTLGEISGILAYVLATNLLESVLFFLVLVMISFLLPPQVMLNKFVTRANVIVVFYSFWSAVLTFDFSWELWPTFQKLLGLGALVVLSIALALFVTSRVRKIEHIIEVIAGRVSVFTYLYVPLGIVGLLIVAVRIVF